MFENFTSVLMRNDRRNCISLDIIKKHIGIFVVLALLAVSIFCQEFLFFPGGALYESLCKGESIGITALCIVTTVPMFAVFWPVFKYKGNKLISFAFLACPLLYLLIGSNRQKEAITRLICEDPYLSIGYVSEYESGRTGTTAYFSFYDINGKCHKVSTKLVFKEKYESDTILVVFNGSRPLYFKCYEDKPEEEELLMCKNGPVRISAEKILEKKEESTFPWNIVSCN